MTKLLILLALALVVAIVLLRRRQSEPPPEPDPLSRERLFADVSTKVAYRARPVLHAGEAALFRLIERMCAAHAPHIRVLAQVNMGEFLGVDDRGPGSPRQREAGQGAINSKRIDILLVDAEFRPRVAIEYQGRRHATDDRTRLRDQAKHTALAAAGIPLVEITPYEAEADWTPRLMRALRGRG